MTYPVTIQWMESNGTEVRLPDAIAASGRELKETLQRIARKADPEYPPLVLVGNDGGVLTIGLGESVSVLTHVPPDGNPPYMTSLGDESAEGEIDFYHVGHHSPFLLRNAIANELAIDVVLEFAETGRLSVRIAWEET